MAYYLPILGALTLAAGTIFERLVLRNRKIDIKLYQVASFFAIILSLIPFLYFFWRLDAAALQIKNIIIFFSVVFFAVIANLLVFYSMKWEKVSNLEPARVLEPLFVILLALVFSLFAKGLYDQNSRVVIPAIVAALALIFSHAQKHHLRFNKYFIAAILGSFFFALELVISRLVLDFYSPISFYFLRSSAIFLISLALFKPNFKKLNTKIKWEIFITGVIWMIYRVIIYYGFVKIGVIFTTLLIMLGPIFIYIFAHFFLKEKIGWRNFVAAIIIVASVIYALV